jgi:GTP diphosphokinase
MKQNNGTAATTTVASEKPVSKTQETTSEKQAKDYAPIIEERAQRVFDVMEQRVTPQEMEKIREAFAFAREAHAPQVRKTGEPYIFHPIAVAQIVAEDLRLGPGPVMAAFLHDVVEDTPHPIEEIAAKFGTEVAFLVEVVTKQKKKKYDYSKQLDNFRQMLNSVQFDIRALLVKLADRLHNMRTLSSMSSGKQMKIAGETDYFFAPLANRLGLYNVKTELENLSMRFRTPHEFDELKHEIDEYKSQNGEKIERFRSQVEETLAEAGYKVKVEINFRQPYSIFRMMKKKSEDFWHLPHPYTIDIIFPDPKDMSEKEMALRIYAILTDRFKEKPGGIINYIDSPKENGYKSFHVKLLSDFGRWQELHIFSESMRRRSQIGCVVEELADGTAPWVEKFKKVLHEIAMQGQEGENFIQDVVDTFYNDDIMTFTPKGKEVVLPQKATVIDFAFELHGKLGHHACHSRINGQLSSIKTRLKRGDVVEIFTSDECTPQEDWLENCVSYKAKKAIRTWLAKQPLSVYRRCPYCRPLPGEDVVGFKNGMEKTMVHKRDCPTAIRIASQEGDKIKTVYFEPDETLYPVTISVRAVDRHHLMIDLLECITNTLNLSMSRLVTTRQDNIVESIIDFSVHSFNELQAILRHISTIEGVDEAREVIQPADSSALAELQ